MNTELIEQCERLRKLAEEAVENPSLATRHRLDEQVQFAGAHFILHLVDAVLAMQNYYSSGIEVFASPCANHSGDNTLPFNEWIERYGCKCVACLVDALDQRDESVTPKGEAE